MVSVTLALLLERQLYSGRSVLAIFFLGNKKIWMRTI